jgi:hypothetical protein
MEFISKDTANKYYRILIQIYNLDIIENDKVPILKNFLEHEILKDVTKINHFNDIYTNNILTETGQKKWLLDNREKRNKNGEIISGKVPKEIVSGIENLFDNRNVAEHQGGILKTVYLGLFTIVAQTIKIFSNTIFPNEINSICNGSYHISTDDKIRKEVSIVKVNAQNEIENSLSPKDAKVICKKME